MLSEWIKIQVTNRGVFFFLYLYFIKGKDDAARLIFFHRITSKFIFYNVSNEQNRLMCKKKNVLGYHKMTWKTTFWFICPNWIIYYWNLNWCKKHWRKHQRTSILRLKTTCLNIGCIFKKNKPDVCTIQTIDK